MRYDLLMPQELAFASRAGKVSCESRGHVEIASVALTPCMAGMKAACGYRTREANLNLSLEICSIRAQPRTAEDLTSLEASARLVIGHDRDLADFNFKVNGQHSAGCLMDR